MFIVDTNIFVDLLRRHQPAVAWARDNHSKILIPSVVVVELLRKVELSRAQRRFIWKLVNQYRFVDPGESDWSRARGTLREWDEKHKVPDVTDIIIAQTAIGMDLPVATKNTSDFENIKGCKYVDPY